MNVLKKLKGSLDRNRLGELLVTRGEITTEELTRALGHQKVSGDSLGRVLQDMGLITGFTLRTTLFQQLAYRGLAATLAFVIGFAAFGPAPAGATSSTVRMNQTVAVRSLPEGTQDTNIQNVSYNPDVVIRPLKSYPSLFGSTETASGDISPFTKWTGLLARLDRNSRGGWLQNVTAYRGESLRDMAFNVNKYVNTTVRYVEDKNNYGVSDYWATPDEFFARNAGDCEDFAIAKYAALKALGVPEERMRLTILQDTKKGIPHAILVVYTDEGPMLLDNQIKNAVPASTVGHYRPIYSINQNSWWRHMG